MNKLTYKIFRLLKLPLLCCSGCMKENCEFRLPYFQAPCISWREFSNWKMPERDCTEEWLALLSDVSAKDTKYQKDILFIQTVEGKLLAFDESEVDTE